MSNLGVKQADVLWQGRRMWVAVRLGGAVALGTYRREYNFFGESERVTWRARLKR